MRSGGEPKIEDQQDVGSIAVILGAGFSAAAGVPLASQLFDRRPDVDRLVRQRLVERVTHEWGLWYARTGGSPEEYLAGLATRGGLMWREAVWFVSLVIASRMGKLRPIREQHQLTGHYIQKRSPAVLERFWTTLFRIQTDVSVITTNYDILAERGWVRLFFVGGPTSVCGGGEAGGSWIRQRVVVVRKRRRGPVSDGTCAVSDRWGGSAGTRALRGRSQYASKRRLPGAP